MNHETITRFLKDRNYIHPEHAESVLEVIVDVGITDNITQVSALLHDVLDYSDATPQDVTDAFGDAVGNITLELFHDLRSPSANLLVCLMKKASGLSPQATSILMADLITGFKIESMPPDLNYKNRQILAWLRELIGEFKDPHPILKERLEEAADAISLHLGYPPTESMADVHDEIITLVEGEHDIE